VSGVFLALGFLQLQASQPLLFEGFESYVPGILDANTPADQGGSNPAPNGGPGNPWWAPSVSLPSFWVANAETYTIPGAITNNATPHSGTNMVRGPGGVVNFSQEFYNIAYRLNGSNVFTTNAMFDWWFFDPIGTNAGGGF